jgi:hypothetical protein
MNIYLLLSRLLAILYAGFFMLFAFGEGITGHGATHLPAPVLVLIGLIVFWEKPGWSSVLFGLLFVTSVWFYKAWTDINLSIIISLPLAVIMVLNLIAWQKKRKNTSTGDNPSIE